MILMLLTTPCYSATKVWTGGGDGVSWDNGANWDLGSCPDATDIVYINESGITTNTTIYVNNTSAASFDTIYITGNNNTAVPYLYMNVNMTGGNITIDECARWSAPSAIKEVVTTGTVNTTNASPGILSYRLQNVRFNMTGANNLYTQNTSSSWQIKPRIKCGYTGTNTTVGSAWVYQLDIVEDGTVTANNLILEGENGSIHPNANLSTTGYLYYRAAMNMTPYNYTYVPIMGVYRSGAGAFAYSDVNMNGSVRANTVVIGCNQYSASDAKVGRLITNNNSLDCTNLNVSFTTNYFYGALECGASYINVSNNFTAYNATNLTLPYVNLSTVKLRVGNTWKGNDVQHFVVPDYEYGIRNCNITGVKIVGRQIDVDNCTNLGGNVNVTFDAKTMM